MNDSICVYILTTKNRSNKNYWVNNLTSIGKWQVFRIIMSSTNSWIKSSSSHVSCRVGYEREHQRKIEFRTDLPKGRAFSTLESSYTHNFTVLVFKTISWNNERHLSNIIQMKQVQKPKQLRKKEYFLPREKKKKKNNTQPNFFIYSN